MWEQEGQIGRSRTAGKGPVGEAPKKREGKIGPWGKPVGGGGHKRCVAGRSHVQFSVVARGWEDRKRLTQPLHQPTAPH